MIDNRPTTAPLWLAAGGAALGQTFVHPGVTVADVGLALAAALVVAGLPRGRYAPVFPRWSMIAAAWFGWCVLGGAVRIVDSPLAFSVTELLKSLAKLGFYSAAAWLLALSLAGLATDRMKDVVLWVLAANAAVALYIYVVMTAGLDLPYRFFWVGGKDVDLALSWGASAFDRPLVRARGLAGEPSYFGLFQLLGLAVVYTRGALGAGRHRWREALVLISVVLTFSLGVYLLLAVFVLAVGWRALRLGTPVVRRALIPALVMVAALAAIPAVRESAANLVAFRVAMATGGSPDASVELRTVVNIRVTGQILRAAPIFGAGLGNFDVAWAGLRPRLGAASRFAPEQGWSGILYAFGTTGVVGGMLFALLLIEVCRRNPSGGVVLITSLFATSAILAEPFWLVLVLLATPVQPAERVRDDPG
jgi:hypothetical protein